MSSDRGTPCTRCADTTPLPACEHAVTHCHSCGGELCLLTLAARHGEVLTGERAIAAVADALVAGVHEAMQSL